MNLYFVNQNIIRTILIIIVKYNKRDMNNSSISFLSTKPFKNYFLKTPLKLKKNDPSIFIKRSCLKICVKKLMNKRM